MATLTSGDTLSLNALATATGNTPNSNVSLGTIKGSPVGGDNIALSDYAIDSVGSISGYLYATEGSTETYTITYGGAGTRFSQLTSVASNAYWDVLSGGTYIALDANSGGSATFDMKHLSNSELSDDTFVNAYQTVLQNYQTTQIRAAWSDGYNQHATDYGIIKSRYVYVVDTYDGNATALCLTADTPVLLSDGTQVEIGDLEEGMKLKGYNLNGLLPSSEQNMLEWKHEGVLTPEEVEVEVVNMVFSFADRVYSINNGLLKATTEHPFAVNSNGIRKFKPVHLLELGDKLIKHDGTEDEITSIEIQEGTVEIVSLDVNGPDTYLANGYITHNKGGSSHTDFNGPAAPTNLAYNSGTGFLSWTAPSNTLNSGVRGYEVWVSNYSDFRNGMKEDNYSSTSISLPGNIGIAGGSSYARVRAIEGGKYGSWTSTLGPFTI